MNSKKRLFCLVMGLLIVGITLLSSSVVRVDAVVTNWINLPPYNTLWPLWSPALSPVNATTGLRTPIVSNLAHGNVLPVQPGLTWDPRVTYPWLLYNIPGGGMCYFDPYYGIQSWPPTYLQNSATGLPAPIDLSLVKSWSTLAPTSAAWLLGNVTLANNSYINTYPPYTYATTPLLSSFLTPALILGLPSALIP